MSGPLVGHLMRRGVQAAQDHFKVSDSAYIAKLKHDAHLYEQSDLKIAPMEMIPIVITAILTFAIIASIRYTVGEVMASLAMIESSSSTTILETKSTQYTDEAPPAYTDPEKKSFKSLEANADADVEVSVIKHKPITSKIMTTVGHLHRIGGFRAHWRGVGLSIFYHGFHAAISNTLARFLGLGLVGHFICYVVASLGLARIHMLWTHSMIAHPSTKWFWQRIIPRKQAKAILLPALVFAVSQQATFILPLAVAISLGLPDITHQHITATAQHESGGKTMLLALRFLAVPATAIFVAVGVLLPASVTLTRIEATLLPEEEQTIVSFDKDAIVGDLDLTARGSSRAIFTRAWRSFDRPARLRLIKLYAKMVLAQVMIGLVGLHLALAELYFIGSERLAALFVSGAAQQKLAGIESHNQ